MRDPGTECPVAGDSISARNALGAPGWRCAAGSGHIEARVNLSRGTVFEETRKKSGIASDHHTPGGGSVGFGELLDHFDLLGRTHFRTAPFFRHHQAKHPRFSQMRDNT